jgi:hypothetical protein
MKTIKVKIKGITPLLQHRFTEDELFGLLGTKTTKKKDKGEETPRQIAEKCAYKSDDGTFYIPTEYITGALAYVATEYKQKNSQRKSLKQIIKGIVSPTTISSQLFADEEMQTPINDFEVDVRRATNHQKGAVAVCRPRFDKWFTELELQIDDEIVATETVQEMLQDAGKRSGIGSFRVSKGGIFGKFHVIEFIEVKN